MYLRQHSDYARLSQRVLAPNAIRLMAFGVRNLKDWVLGPSGLLTLKLIQKLSQTLQQTKKGRYKYSSLKAVPGVDFGAISPRRHSGILQLPAGRFFLISLCQRWLLIPVKAPSRSPRWLSSRVSKSWLLSMGPGRSFSKVPEGCQIPYSNYIRYLYCSGDGKLLRARLLV